MELRIHGFGVGLIDFALLANLIYLAITHRIV